MKVKHDSTPFLLYLDNVLKVKLLKLADDRPLSTYINRVLTEYADKMEPKKHQSP